MPAASQRLVYSGRMLKDPETLDSYNIKQGNIVHLVKGAASNVRQNPANAATGSTPNSAPAPGAPGGVPTNIASGTGNDPLAGLTGARYAGFHGLPGADMFGPDGGVKPQHIPCFATLSDKILGHATESRRHASSNGRPQFPLADERDDEQPTSAADAPEQPHDPQQSDVTPGHREPRDATMALLAGEHTNADADATSHEPTGYRGRFPNARRYGSNTASKSSWAAGTESDARRRTATAKSVRHVWLSAGCRRGCRCSGQPLRRAFQPAHADPSVEPRCFSTFNASRWSRNSESARHSSHRRERESSTEPLRKSLWGCWWHGRWPARKQPVRSNGAADDAKPRNDAFRNADARWRW